MPQRPPSRVRMPAALRCLVIDLTPIGPEAPSPSSQAEDQPHGLGLDAVDLQLLLDLRWPRCSAATMR